MMARSNLDDRFSTCHSIHMAKFDSLQCAIEGCVLPVKSRGWCNTHYLRWYRLGNPLADVKPIGLDPWQRFLSHVLIMPNGCWIWQASRDKNGYGKFKLNRKDMRAHVFAWTHWNGSVPKGFVLDHFECNTPPCVNPCHVRPETPQRNSWVPGNKAYDNAHKTHCHRGHEFTPENTYVWKTKFGWGRECRACRPINTAIRKSLTSST